jgi:hypothetical protein
MSGREILKQVAATKFYIMADGMRNMIEDIRSLRVEMHIEAGSREDKLIRAVISEIESVLDRASAVRPGDDVTEDQLATVLEQSDADTSADNTDSLFD